MTSRLLTRALLATTVIAGAIAIGGCDTDQVALYTGAKANRPIPDKLLAEMEAKNIDKASPMLVRLFKQEAELEVWKQDRNGLFQLVKTYPICRWSGDLGPKVKEGDRQAPEGFYTITPAQMNPQSAYYLSFNMGFPNAYDRAWNRTGSQLMVHGDCSSRGCYAMTDEQIGEIYALGRESFFGGQRAFQVQAYPFKMTPKNFAKYRDNPNMAFWKMIKVGNDHFELTRQEPKVDVCEKRYVFDAQPPPGSTKPLVFNPTGACPNYVIPEELAIALRNKERQDDLKTAELIRKGTPAMRRYAGVDGGMHAVFASHVPNGSTGLSEPNPPNMSMAAYSAPPPGTIPMDHVNPPARVDHPQEVGGFPFSFGSSDSSPPPPVVSIAAPATAPAAPKVASATAAAPETTGTAQAAKPGFFSNLAQKMGIKRKNTEATATAAAEPAEKPATTAAAAPAAPRPAAAASLVSAKPAAKPTDTKTADAKTPDPKTMAASLQKSVTQAVAPPAKTAEAKSPDAKSGDTTIAGASPVVPSNSFENRWSSFR